MKRLMQIVVLASAALWMQAHASTLDYYVKVDGIDGESTARGHERWIDVDSFSWGVANGGSAQFMPFGWTQAVDKSTPYIFVAVASGEHFANVQMDTVRSGGRSDESFFTMLFEDAVFTSLQVNGGPDGIDVAGQLVYQVVEMRYRPQRPDGTYDPPIIGRWDVSKGGAFSGDPQVLMGLFLAQPTGIGPLPAVPEPQTWALMILGLACVTLARRLRAA